MENGFGRQEITSGYMFILAAGPLPWTSSSAQRCDVLSITEVENIAASNTGKEAIWLACLELRLGHYMLHADCMCHIIST